MVSSRLTTASSRNPYTDENELICWHYDHAQARMVKGINFITALYTVDEVSLPVTYRLVSKETYIDKRGKPKRRSAVTKNEAPAVCRTGLPLPLCAQYENMPSSAKRWDSRAIAKSPFPDKRNSSSHRLDQLDLPEDTVTVIYLEQVPFPLHLLRQRCTNADGSTAVIWSLCHPIINHPILSEEIVDMSRTASPECVLMSQLRNDPIINHPILSEEVDMSERIA